MNRKLTDAGIILGWALFAIAVSYWFERAVSSAVSPEWIMAIVIAPVFEELAKFVSYRGMRGKFTIVVPLLFIVSEYTNQAIQSRATVEPMVFLLAVALAIFTLKHILFWVPERLFNFKLYSLPLAIIIHMVWNVWFTLDSSLDFLPAAFLAAFCLLMPLLLFKLQKENAFTGETT